MLRYLAGYFDGEGCIHISVADYGLAAQVASNQLAVLNIYKDFFGGGIYNPGKNKCYLWRISCKRAENFLEVILT